VMAEGLPALMAGPWASKRRAPLASTSVMRAVMPTRMTAMAAIQRHGPRSSDAWCGLQ